jgi:outer membrane protein OmpA-like peptidoglycan-associated protein
VGRRKSQQPAETLARRRARAMSATMAAQVVAATSELGAIGYGAELRVQNMK